MSMEDSSVNLDGVLARSRSRYRANRSNHHVTSPKTPPKIRPELPEQQLNGPRNLQTSWEGNANTGALKIKPAPSPACPGVSKDEYNYNSLPSTIKHPAVVPTLSNQRAQTFPEDSLMRQQTTQQPFQHGENSGTRRVGRQIKEDRTRMAGNEVIGFETTLPGEEYIKSVDAAVKKQGSHQIEESHDQLKIRHINSPPKPSNTFELGGQTKLQPSPIPNAPAPNKPSTLQKRSLTHRRQRSNIRDELKRSISAPMPLDQPDLTHKPAFDAPVSAVNAGDRRIRVQLDQTPLYVAVTPSTTPLDIIREAGSQLSMPLDAKMNVLMECFKPLGLERPLRKYERIRDIMNSWDNDSQNSLSIVPSPTGGRDDDLDLTSVASTQPGDTSVHIYHSNSPGSWDKRWITLRSDGQVLMTKRDGKEALNICHLSDFDIYVPTKKQLAKKIKPPKKYCFAVKSQQKSAMFLTTENFVHFFAAGDRELAMAWYKAVQEWRSWYLVNVMGEGQEATSTSPIHQRPTRGFSSDVNHMEGKSLITDGHWQQTAGSGQTQQVPQTFIPKSLPTNHRGTPPVSSPRKLTKDASSGIPTTRNDAQYRASIIRHQPLVAAEPEPFAAQSLLGRAYTERQKAVARMSDEKTQDYGPTTCQVGTGPTSGSDSLQRRSTQRSKQQPLVDLKPTYQEPPQHRRKGMGFTPEHFPSGGLVEAATNTNPMLTNPLELRGADSRKSSTARNHNSTDTRAAASPEKHGRAFTGGLLSSVQMQGQDGAGTGHGFRTGDRAAKEPLLDMTMEGPWAKGSLLDRVNSGDSGTGPPVDREKRHEMDAPVGEGL